MRRVSSQNIFNRKGKKRISVLTAYDYPLARLVDEAGLDIVLVGDSLGMVVFGEETTLRVTMDEMVRHTRAVSRAVRRALIVSDMPYRSYLTPSLALKNARRLIRNGKAQAVKLEGGSASICQIVRFLRKHHVAVMGHIGLLPQSVRKLGGYKVQGRSEKEADRLLKEAQALEQAGVFSMVLECIPARLAQRITRAVGVPTIGIGAGLFCDGQVLVLHDLLGLYDKIQPKFVRRFATLRTPILKALRDYKKSVENKSFPSLEESF